MKTEQQKTGIRTARITARWIISLVLLLIMLDAATAATLHGSIYDIELNELSNVIVKVNSEPQQRYVSKDGRYSFELNPGEYTITAVYTPDKLHEYKTTETVLIKQEGDFVYDLFLFPGFDPEDESMLEEPDVLGTEDTNVDIQENIDGQTIMLIAAAIILIFLIAYFIVRSLMNKERKKELEQIEEAEEQAKKTLEKEMENAIMRKQQKKKASHEHLADTEDPCLKNVIDIIRKEGGRTTQKELRKQIPLSEAKISLMISELEHRKIIQKVKKGRGNILILKKKHK